MFFLRAQYDYRHRVISTTVHPRDGQALTPHNYCVDDQLFYREDAYGRKTYYAYRASDGALIREVKGTVPSFSLAEFSAVLNYTRAAAPDSNSAAIVTDRLLSADGQQTKRIDGRGIEFTAAYDSRGRQTESIAAAGTAVEAKTVTVYDAVGNVTEIQHPRYFDTDDEANALVKFTRRAYGTWQLDRTLPPRRSLSPSSEGSQPDSIPGPTSPPPCQLVCVGRCFRRSAGVRDFTLTSQARDQREHRPTRTSGQ